MSALAADTDGAWTLVSTDGSTHGHEPIELNPNQRQETLAVELYEEDVPLAMGTIQIAELHKVRGQAGKMAWVWGGQVVAGLSSQGLPFPGGGLGGCCMVRGCMQAVIASTQALVLIGLLPLTAICPGCPPPRSCPPSRTCLQRSRPRQASSSRSSPACAPRAATRAAWPGSSWWTITAAPAAMLCSQRGWCPPLAAM